MGKMIRKHKRSVSMFLTAILLISTFLPAGAIKKASASIAEHVVISQVYGGGGNSGAPFNKDFIELYNPTDQEVSLEGWSIQYASSAGTGWNVTKLSGTIPAYGYYLIAQAGGATGEELPAPDATGGAAMSATSGKVALMNTTTAGFGNMPAGTVDFVGFGAANAYEGTGPAKSPSNTTSAQRRPYANVAPAKGLGNAWDSDDNMNDFVAGVPTPRNTKSPIERPMQSAASLAPIGRNIQFTPGKIAGFEGAVPANSIVTAFETKGGTSLASGTAVENGSFELTFGKTDLKTVFLTAKQEGKDASEPVEIQLAAASAQIAADKLSYMVDSKGVGTLTGNAGAAIAQAAINVYPNETANPAERFQPTDGEKVLANASGAFTYVFAKAPEKIYVTQQTVTAKGINLESTPVAAEKPSLEVITPINVMKETDAKGLLVNLNKFFTVEGVVTIENGILGTQKNNYYIQDETGGVNVFGSFDSKIDVKRGDKVKVTGKVLDYNGLTELEPTAIVKISEGNPIPSAKPVTIENLNTFAAAEPLEGSLVNVTGKVSAVAATGTNYNITFVDENNKATTLRVMEKTGIKPDTDLVIGKSYAITGIVGQYTTNASKLNGYQVYPRDVKDIAAQLGLEHTPIKEAYEDTAVEFVANASGAEAVTVYYRAKEAEGYTAIPMAAGSEGRYTAVLEADKVPAAGFEYYIEAKAGDKTSTSGTSAAPYSVSLVKDTAGPEFYGENPIGGLKTESPRPEISVLIKDPSGVKEDSIKVWFDGKEIDYTKAVISKSQVKFTPQADLEIGLHTTKVTAADTKGNVGTYEWTFESVPRFTGGNHYLGTTHNHTNISHDGAGAPEEALKAGQSHNYDWFAFSDHSHDIDPALLGQDTVNRGDTPERKGGADWQLTKDLAAKYTKDGDYVVFPAFEMTSTTWGHSNIFGSENFIDRNINSKMYQDLNKYYAWVMTYDDIVGQFNHPDMSKAAFNDFKPYQKEVDKLFTMLEVGNGSGHYGYANAEKKFFSVLDLGWHVAPTYGEDNHEGTWGQTNARTVIVSKDLSQESLLHSMRNMRVYMVEDPNFTMDVSANGYYMGSTVDSKNLSFSISGSDSVTESRSSADYSYLPADYKSDDRVAKVELISNAGKVVDTYEPMTKEFTWKPSYTVKGGQQWFVVRVTQMDGERAYSSPIWSKEEAVDVKVNSIDVTGDVIVAGNPATLKANVSNNGTQAVSNLKVDLYVDEVKDANLIGTQTISSIQAKGVGTAAIKWESPIKGDHTIIATVSSLDGMDLGDTAFLLPVKIKEPLGVKILIDGAHGNENSSGDSGTYANNLKAFTTILQKEGYTVSENKVPFTDAVLKDVSILVLTHPRTAYTEAERAAIAKFTANGGSVLMAGKSNNSTNPTISNPLLADIGTKIRMNNDGVFDDSKTGNFWSDPKVSPYAVRAFPGLVSNYITDRVHFLDYYSGSSLMGADGQPLAEGGSLTILAKGNETTYQGNLKAGGFAYDTVSDDKGGSAIPLIASEELGSKGRIIVSGMNIFNDKQMDESYEDKGNDQFSLNAINWLANRETKVTSIGDARKLAEDTETVIEGTVTTAAGVFFDAFYVQDETGGIMAFNEVPDGSLKLGDKVRIYGHIISFDNNKEIEFAKFDQDVIKIGSGTPLEPKLVPTGEATSVANQGLLVKVKGKVVSKFDENSYFINDGSGQVLVFTDGYIVNQSGPVPALKPGDTLEAVGMSGMFAQGERIRVRDTRELIGTADTTPPEAPVVNVVTDADTVITGTAEGGSTVIAKVFAKVIGEATTGADGSFTIKIAKQPADTVITVTATDASGNESAATETVVKDATPPAAPAVNRVRNADDLITGIAEAGSKVVAKVDGQIIGSATADSQGKYNIKIKKLKHGTTISVTATDAAGNESKAATTIVTAGSSNNI
ncbi:DUF4350 domain-containing protein [Bacillus sp. B-jedd]|uniref:DUF4350 domain-containing protein n=1 Tax=Bacillus sp. B-jedd TaxID=1476857 RepID=UPI000515676C|nr:DUF4350 domain-containing protein [Bacillus sp. B-jedd]CEG29122.1 Ig domain-containing protein [Bacillus sp. B-jedd]